MARLVHWCARRGIRHSGFFLLRADKTARIVANAADLSARAAVAIELPTITAFPNILAGELIKIVVGGDTIAVWDHIAFYNHAELTLIFRNQMRMDSR